MKDFKQEILTALPGLLNPEIDRASESTAATFSKDSILRNPLVARLISAAGSWVETQGNLIMRLLGNFIEFTGNKLPEKPSVITETFGNWRGKYFEGIPERVRAATANGTLPEENARIAAEVQAMREIQILLYPPEAQPPPFDWSGKLKSGLAALDAQLAPLAKGFADWAETLPGAKR